MFTNEDENRLAELNELSEDLRVDRIKKRIGASGYDKDKENAIHRKVDRVILFLLEKLLEMHGLELDDPAVEAFIKYDEDIKKIIKEVEERAN